MTEIIEIIQSLLIPKLENDICYNTEKTNLDFWNRFANAFLEFDNDPKPTYELIYSLDLSNSEIILDKLPTVFSDFIRELAENYVLSNNKLILDEFKIFKNPVFIQQFAFLKTMQQAIKKIERQSIKENLPKFYERVSFEVSNNEFIAITKKVGRDDLKAKFKVWDTEIDNKKNATIMYSLGREKSAVTQPRFFSLSYVKYAVAACFVLASSFWFFKYFNSDITPIDNKVVINDTINVVTPTVEIPIEAVAYTTKISKKSIQYPSSLGFVNTSKSNFVTIYVKDASKSIEKIQNILKIEIDKNGNSTDINYKSLKKQLDLLVIQQDCYEFNGKQLIIYSNDLKLSCSVLSQDDKTFYLKMYNHYYQLNFTKLPLKFKPIKDSELIEQLEKTSFENEE